MYLFSACTCSNDGATSQKCDSISGSCNCKEGFKGKRCDECQEHWFGFPDCKGMFFVPQYILLCTMYLCVYVLDCQCSSGSVNEICNKNNGACSCKTGFDGEKCDQCKSGFYGFPSCKPCQCNTSGSRNGNICDAQTGQCDCKSGVSGHNCTKCGLNRYNFPSCNGM